MAVIYEHSGGVSAIALPAPSRIEATPFVPGRPAEYDNRGQEISPAVPEVQATYRIETPMEQVARLSASGRLPNLSWTRWLLVPDDHPALRGGTITVGDWTDPASVTVTFPPRFPDLAAARTAMLARIEAIEVQITGPVSEGERQSWTAKEAEARAFVADATAQTPILSAEAQITGEPLADLAAKVIARATLFKAAAGAIAGLRRATDTQLAAVTDPNDYETVLAAADAQAAALAAQLGITLA